MLTAYDGARPVLCSIQSSIRVSIWPLVERPVVGLATPRPTHKSIHRSSTTARLISLALRLNTFTRH